MKYIIKTAKKLLPILCVIAGYGALMLLRRYKIVNPYMIQILMFAGVNIMMTVSLNLVNGFHRAILHRARGLHVAGGVKARRS
jgi:branched-chain amino acid transport system permease protein